MIATPVPVSDSLSGEVPELDATTKVSLTEPTCDAGAKVTITVQLPLAAIDKLPALQVPPVMEK